ncbi:hypothetical protein [Rhodoferax sp.]|uniref:hypothetical protein n=1 Tax=Rhodoferax sp. TaxID=50421 RepID=UPI0027264FE9|nr:hypothetical protein [Rhodoferax sp.]MDO8318106.1 hypothetical protein [Rhodoferax sp.]
MDWSREEVEAIIADYLNMLALELSGQSFNKTEHRKSLQTKLNGRSDASIEVKHCNISAAMIDLGFPIFEVINHDQTIRHYWLQSLKIR